MSNDLELIPFNKVFLTGKEQTYLNSVLSSGNLVADGIYTPKCRSFFSVRYQFENTFLTSSCTAALEMMALLLDIQAGDEIIAPAYTFVSTVNPFILRGARIRFADSLAHSPNIDPEAVAALINAKTKAIIVMHYAGEACDMKRLQAIASDNNIPLLEDAAHAIDSFYEGKPLGSFGQMSAFSFHASKNIVAGEAGLLVLNETKYLERAQVLFEKGTNRKAFSRGEVKAYEWMDIGSSFAASELNAACLMAQLESIEVIQQMRLRNWNHYHTALSALAQKSLFQLPYIDANGQHNAHLYYVVCRSKEERIALSEFLAKRGIETAFHYQALHQSPFYLRTHPYESLPQAERYADCLLRLPVYPDLTQEALDRVVAGIYAFFGQ